MKQLFYVSAFALITLISLDSCKRDFSACTDPKADNYNSAAVSDDGSCLYAGLPLDSFLAAGGSFGGGDSGIIGGGGDMARVGCMDPNAANYDSTANIPGFCIIYGCLDTAANNYDSSATVNAPDSCVYFGCTDPRAENYNPKANFDDGSCIDIRQKFAGTWDVTHNCGFRVNLEDPMEILFDPSERDTVTFVPFLNGANAIGLVDKNALEIPLQIFGSVEVEAIGSINAARDQINLDIDYNITIPFIGGPGTCKATFDKQ